jgi:uncharacterized protein (DUF2225 family)
MKLCARTIVCLLVFALLFSLTSGSCFATSSRRVEAKCPVCDHGFSASQLMSSNNFGGYDSDLCPHAMGSSPLMNAIWGCPSCYFCGFSSAFEKPFTDSEKQNLKKWLKQNVKIEEYEKDAEAANSYDLIPAYRRYEIAAELSIKNNAGAIETAHLFMKAAWCCRHLGLIKQTSDARLDFSINEKSAQALFKFLNETARKIKPSANRAADMVQILKKAAASLSSLQIPESDLAQTYLAMAKLLRSSGENVLAQDFLAKSLEKDSSEQNKQMTAAIKASIAAETRYQKKAVLWLEKALQQSEPNSRENMENLVMLAETCRRTGDNETAEKYFMQLFEQRELPPFFQEIATAGLESMGKTQLLSPDKLRELEKGRIKKALSLLPDFIDGRSVIGFLRESTDRAEIYPELVKLVQGNDMTAAENALRAMSDSTQEAIDFQVGLFKKGLHKDVVVKNLYELGGLVQPEPFFEDFEKTPASEYADQLLNLIRAIGGKKAAEMILARAEKEFTVETIARVSKNKPDNYEISSFYRNLIYSLVSCDDLRALAVLQRIIENVEIKGFNYGYRLAEAAGTAIELITNHYFGFSIVLTREREPQFPQPDEDIINNPYGTARNNLKEWLEKNGSTTHEQMIAGGFKEAGYSILPASDPECLKELIDGLSDKLKSLRYHSYNLLARRTGISFKPHIGRDLEAYPKEYREIIWFYTDWLEKNRSSLVFNEKTGVFAIKK